MKNLSKYIAIVIICFSLCYTTKASSVIVLNDSISSFEITPNTIQVFEDGTNSKQLADIKLLGDKDFTANKNLVTEQPFNTYWVKFSIQSNFTNRNKWIIEVLDSRHYDIELYIPQSDGKYQTLNAGLKYPFNSRNYLHKNFVMDLHLIPGTTNTFYLKFKSHVVGSMLFKIRANDEFSSYAFNEYYLLGNYYGIIIVILLLNLILYFSLKESLYFLYALYIVSWAWNSMLDDGIGYQYIWSSAPGISQLGFIVGRLLMIVLFVYYSKQFLTNENSFLKYDKWVKYSVAFYIANFILSQFIKYPDIIFASIFLVPFVTVYIVSIKVYKDGFKPARFFIIGNAFIILGFVVRIVKDQNILDLSPSIAILFNYSQNFGILFEICTLFIALGDRFRFLKAQKEEASLKIIEQLKENQSLSEKVNKELEGKVTERTKELTATTEELKELNIKLEKQAEEISKWNQLLDIDNHNLKKKVKEEIEARIKFEDVGYEQFLQIFPDELACQRYIDEIKWKDGFTCKKCNNNKFSNGSKLFSRRCTKCGYNESVTAFTFLHKCKFSLVKAFYIMMKVNKYGEEVNCAELARELEMRNATVWEFKNKIIETKEGKQKSLDILIFQNLNNH